MIGTFCGLQSLERIQRMASLAVGGGHDLTQASCHRKRQAQSGARSYGGSILRMCWRKNQRSDPHSSRASSSSGALLLLVQLSSMVDSANRFEL